jgi:hypothetical protein
MRPAHGRLQRRFRHGDVTHPGFLDDYAYLIWGLIELYEAVFEVRYLEEAVHLNQIMIELFWEEAKGGFSFSGRDNEVLISRPRDLYDGAVPSGNSVAALNLLRLSRMTGRADLEKKADQLLQGFSGPVAEYPMAYTQFLIAVDFMLGPSREIVIAGDLGLEESREMIAFVQHSFLPNKVLLLKPEGEGGQKLSTLSPFVEAMRPLNNRPTVYLCEGYTCKAPLADLAGLKAALK